MMAWAAAKKVEESKVAMDGDVRPHHFVPFGVEVYSGLRLAAYGFLRNTQRRLRVRRYMEANVGGKQVDGDGGEDEDEEAAHGGTGATEGFKGIGGRSWKSQGAPLQFSTSFRSGVDEKL
ncbi:hypothetical protein CYMTET_29117 [Cymbomonas tetramitiformis]|uniref:Uncharacterized protein n=1 Tax=Cymbomonas tetramitiformis TaxID=36881 RepID=A0AAE0KV99_9CHLO|nr:hypothetical protein CYMTET_29117 [Cymbomonas tetramitiformis]